MHDSDHRPKGSPSPASLPLPVRRDELIPRLARALERRLRGRVPGDGRAAAVVAVSGGADSVALLLAMAVLADRRRRPWPRPLAVHVHHHLRGADADADAAFVAELAGRLGLPHERRDVHPRAEPGSIAAAARRLRLDALADAAAASGRRVVLTAHHAEDQLETILMRLARGVDPSRLGMAATRPIAPDSPILLVRPLLETPRADLRRLCEHAGLGSREDPSNADPTHPRVRLRTSVLPVLEAVAPGAAARAAATVSRDAPHPPGPGSSGRTGVAFARADLERLPPAERSAAVRAAALELVPAAADRLTRAAVTAVADAVADGESSPRRWPWPGGLTVSLDVRHLRLERPDVHSGPLEA